MVKRKKAREAIIGQLEKTNGGGWLTGMELTRLIPDIHPSTIRIAALMLSDEGTVDRERIAGETGKGSAVRYRLPT